MERALVVGGGAREHAIVRALVMPKPEGARKGAEVVAAPGNPGIAALPGVRIAAVAADDVEGLVRLAADEKVDLVVIGPEKPLTLGLADALRARGIATFGPGRQGAELEASKAFMKEFLRRHRIPTAPFRVFDDAAEAIAYIRREARPLVVKADGLAAGKGVVVASDTADAIEAVESMMQKRVFGDAGARVVIEDLLPGEEASYHVVACVGQRKSAFVPLWSAQDHKRVFDGDRGPNTGGMGAYAPAPVVTPEVEQTVIERIVLPTLEGLAAEGIDYAGVIFVGLMIDRGEPRVLEYNVRFGDPEATVLFPLLGEHAWDLLASTAIGTLGADGHRVLESSGAALSVVLAAEGYPATPTVGDVIEGLDGVADAFVHHAGTKREGATVVTAGGRVLTVTGQGASLAEAHARAYGAVAQLSFRGMHYRKDIGARALDKKK